MIFSNWDFTSMGLISWSKYCSGFNFILLLFSSLVMSLICPLPVFIVILQALLATFLRFFGDDESHLPSTKDDSSLKFPSQNWDYVGVDNVLFGCEQLYTVFFANCYLNHLHSVDFKYYPPLERGFYSEQKYLFVDLLSLQVFPNPKLLFISKIIIILTVSSHDSHSPLLVKS